MQGYSNAIDVRFFIKSKVPKSYVLKTAAGAYHVFIQSWLALRVGAVNVVEMPT